MGVLTAGDLRKGKCILHNKVLYNVSETEFRRQGRGGSTIYLTLRCMKTGAQKEISSNADDKFETIDISSEEKEYLYNDGEMIYCSDGSCFSINLATDGLVPLLEDVPENYQASIIIKTIDGEPCEIRATRLIPARIVETEPYIKGQAVTSSYKNAKLVNGKIIGVPPYVEECQYIIYNTEDNTFDSKCT